MERFAKKPLKQELIEQLSQEVSPRRQTMRLVRLGKNFRKAIKGLPNEQEYLDKHRTVTRTIIRDASEIEGRY